MFSVTVSDGTSVKCWWTMPRPAAMASAGLPKRTGAPSTATVPASGLVQAGEDVHERGLARAVLAQQRVDLAPPQVEVDLVVGDQPGESLDDPPHLDRERLRSVAMVIDRPRGPPADARTKSSPEAARPPGMDAGCRVTRAARR